MGHGTRARSSPSVPMNRKRRSHQAQLDDGGKTMSTHTELDELVATSGSDNIGGVLSPESAEPRDACVGDDMLLSLHTSAHDHSNKHDNTTAPNARVGALMAHHPAWISHHPSGSRQDTHGTLGRPSVAHKTHTRHKEFMALA